MVRAAARARPTPRTTGGRSLTRSKLCREGGPRSALSRLPARPVADPALTKPRDEPISGGKQVRAAVQRQTRREAGTQSSGALPEAHPAESAELPPRLEAAEVSGQTTGSKEE